MFARFFKFIYMIYLGIKYIGIYKKTFFNTSLSKKQLYFKLSQQRQEYCKKILNHLNIKLHVDGELPKQDKVLYIINHRSLLDIIVLENIFATYGKSGVWIAKQELFDAFYGDFFKYSGSIAVDIENKKGLLSFFKTIKTLLRDVDNLNIYMFPEGERYKGEGILLFQSGVVNIAKANNLKIVPIFINEKLEVIFKQSPFKKKKTIKVHIGEMTGYENIEQKYIEFVKNKI